MSTSPRATRAGRIHDALIQALAPADLHILDESHMHATGAGAESHFKVVVVSSAFAGKGLLARHRAVQGALAAELAAGLHALSIQAHTPEEWAARGETIPASPPCLGGSKHEG